MIRRLLHKDWIIALMMVGVLYAFAYVPIFWNYYQKEQGRIYLGFIAYPIDTLGNLAIVQQGFAGALTRTAFVSSAIPAQGTYIKTIYTLIGNVARVTNISPLLMFKVVVFVLSISFILSLWFIISNIFKTKITRLTAFFLSLYSTGITIPNSLKGWEYIRSDSEVFQRSTILQPHYMFGAICSLLSVFLLSKSIDTRNVKTLMAASLLGFIAMWTYPPCMALIYAGLAVYLFMICITKHTFSFKINLLRQFVVFCLFSILPYFYFSYANQFFDNDRFLQVEHVFFVKFHFIEYLSLIGSIIIPSLIAIPWIVKRGSTFIKVCLSIIIVHPFFVLFLADRMSVNQIRFIQTPYFIYFALVGTIGFREIIRFFKKHFNFYKTVFIGFVCVLGIIIPSWYTYILSATYNSERFSQSFGIDLGYPQKDEYDAIIWLAQNGKKNSVVLSSTKSGSLILALAPVRVYASTWFGALQLIPEAEKLLPPMYEFYSGDMTPKNVYQFLKDNSIMYVYFGSDEKSLNHIQYGGVLPYQGLTKIYSNTGVTIYEVALDTI